MGNMNNIQELYGNQIEDINDDLFRGSIKKINQQKFK